MFIRNVSDISVTFSDFIWKSKVPFFICVELGYIAIIEETY